MSTDIKVNLEGKTAVVTGGGGGIGLHLCCTLAKAGAQVVIADIKGNKRAEEGQRMLVEQDCKALFVEVDVGEEESVKALFENTVGNFGPPDILINSAAVVLRKSLLETTTDEWDRSMNINLRGAVLCSKMAAGYMIQRGWGRIVNIASLSGFLAQIDRAAYCTSKAALMALTKCMAVEWITKGVNVNAIAPVMTRTPETAAYIDANPERIQELVEGRIAIQRLGQLNDYEGIILFLVSDACEFMVGQTIFVDGGASILW
jgi:NAD(P)-dependent dehydrogenase (short-subunit alcohol dehydrogenase family)